MNRPFRTYNGGKNGSGVFQAIINQIPPHGIFVSGFAGNCGVLANKLRAPLANIAIDLDAAVIEAWKNIPGITAINNDAISFLPDYIKCLPPELVPHVFVFLDPPYADVTRSTQQDYYKFEMRDQASHIKMLGTMAALPVNICITHYPCQLYDDALPAWRKLDIQGRTRKGMRTERLYMNYPAPDALHDYRYIGSDFRERELYKKAQKNFIAKINRMPALERNFILSQINNL